jgi:hypothetical protein
VLEVWLKIGEHFAEERVGGRTVGQRLEDPRWRHRTGLAQRRAHRVRPPRSTFGFRMQGTFMWEVK